VCLRRGSGVATGTAWTILLAAAPTSSGGLKCTFLLFFMVWAGWQSRVPSARPKKHSPDGPTWTETLRKKPGLIEPYLSAILSPIRGTTGRLRGDPRDGRVQGWRNRGSEARRFGSPSWVRMGRPDAGDR